MTLDEAPDRYAGNRAHPYPDFATAQAWERGLCGRAISYLLEQGQTGLSVAFDLPTQLGLDSDDPRAEGEVGNVGVAIDSLEDMARLFDGIPLDKVTTSVTINAPALVLLLLYELVAERQGVAPGQLGGTIQNDILKEYAARGTHIFPPLPLHAADHRHVCLLPRAHPQVDHNEAGLEEADIISVIVLFGAGYHVFSKG